MNENMVVVTEISMLCAGPGSPAANGKDGKSKEERVKLLKTLEAKTNGCSGSGTNLEFTDLGDFQEFLENSWSLTSGLNGSTSKNLSTKFGDFSVQVLVGGGKGRAKGGGEGSGETKQLLSHQSKKAHCKQKKKEFEELTEWFYDSTGDCDASAVDIKLPKLVEDPNKGESIEQMTKSFYEQTLDECRRRAEANVREDAMQACSVLEEEAKFSKCLSSSHYTRFKHALLTKLVVSVCLSRGAQVRPDPRFLSDYCCDSMLDQFESTLYTHLGTLVTQPLCSRPPPRHDPYRWFDTRELMDYLESVDPYETYLMPKFDAKGRPVNIVILTELANILEVHCRVLVKRAYDRLTIADSEWLPLVEACLCYGVMLQDFLATLSPDDSWTLLRKCLWLVVLSLSEHPLIEHSIAKQYLKLPRPELPNAMNAISCVCLDKAPLSTHPTPFKCRLQPFRFLQWYMNPHHVPDVLCNHVYLHDYVKTQLPCPRVALSWDQVASKHNTEEMSESLLKTLEIFIQVEKRRLEVAIEGIEDYIRHSRVAVVLFELGYWLKKMLTAKKLFSSDAYYLTIHHFDDPRFCVPVQDVNYAMNQQYCKREVIYYLTARFCLQILHEEMGKFKQKLWDTNCPSFQTFRFLFRRLFLPHLPDNSYVFTDNDTSYDRVAAKIVETMRIIMQREDKKPGPNDLHSEDLFLFTNETTQTYVRLEQQVTASLNDVILSATNQKQVDNFISRVLEALVATTLEKHVETIDWLFMGRCVPLYILDLYKLLAKNNLLGYPSVFAYSTKTFIDKFLHEKITTDGKTIDQFLNSRIKDERICPHKTVDQNPFVKKAEQYFRNHEGKLIKSLYAPLPPNERRAAGRCRKK